MNTWDAKIPRGMGKYLRKGLNGEYSGLYIQSLTYVWKEGKKTIKVKSEERK